MVLAKKFAAVIALTVMAALAASGAPASERKAAAKPRTAKARPAAADSRYAGEPISLDLKDADLKDVLRTFAELEKINIAIDPEVRDP